MDNFNALSKSAILTKLALDGYFIDLLTLNSFIKEWQIEAIYENEFGVEFFDNTSYETILGRLKERYNKTKEGLEGNLKEKYKEASPSPEIPAASENPAVSEPYVEKSPVENIENISSNNNMQSEASKPANSIPVNENYDAHVSLDDLAKASALNSDAKEDAKVFAQAPVQPPMHAQNAENIDKDSVSLDEIQNKANLSAQKKAIEKQTAKLVKAKESIMPRAMKRLTPSPVSPMTCVNLNKSYDEFEEDYFEEAEEFIEVPAEEYTEDVIIENESFSQEEIEKADNLINNAGTSKNEAPNVLQKAAENKPKEDSEAKDKDELDLMQLAQTFAQNLTGGPSSAKDVPPADLEKIFNESYVEPFEELQDFVMEPTEEDGEEFKPEEYKSLQEGVPSDVVVPEVQPNISLMPKEMNTASLTAQDIRDIIRDEIAKQTANVVPKPQNGEDVREIIREIVKQSTEIAPQNAFKLDISHGTLDMIAKSIAKSIAVKLNSYYKLNSTKQNAKLQQFRERTIELKERNQTLTDENKKLKRQLTEAREILNAYKPSMFGLFKFTGKKRR